MIGLAAMALFAAVVSLLLMGASPSRARLMITPMTGGVIVASFAGGWMVSRTRRRNLFPVLGLLAATLSYCVLSWATRAGLGAPPLEAMLVVMGLEGVMPFASCLRLV